MNKSDYIREVDEIHASDSLKDRINAQAPQKAVKNKRAKRITGVIAACLAVAVIVGGAYGVGTSFSAEKKSYDGADTNGTAYNTDESADKEGSITDVNGEISAQKLIKKARVFMETKDADELMKKINSEIGTLNGYTSTLTQNRDEETISIETKINVPSEKLDEFIAFLEQSGTVSSKNIESTDVTEDYIGTESRITALETEEKALLEILGKSETVQDTMSVQDRLAQVRGELETLRAQKESYDKQISYSEVLICISEVDRVKKSSTSFGSQVSEKFSESLYNIGRFFKNSGVFILGASPYLVIVAVAAAVVVTIVKKKKK